MLHNQHPIPHSSFHFYRLVEEQKKMYSEKEHEWPRKKNLTVSTYFIHSRKKNHKKRLP